MVDDVYVFDRHKFLTEHPTHTFEHIEELCGEQVEREICDFCRVASERFRFFLYICLMYNVVGRCMNRKTRTPDGKNIYEVIWGCGGENEDALIKGGT